MEGHVKYVRDVLFDSPTLRRKCHDEPGLLIFHDIRKIENIRHSPRGITVECRLEEREMLYRFELKDIWLANSSHIKIREYFQQMTPYKLKRLRGGRLKFLIIAAFSKTDPRVYYNQWCRRNIFENKDSGFVRKFKMTETTGRA